MLKSQIPTKFVEAFGANAAAGMIRPIPTASQIGIVNGAASLNDGFPPLTATPLASGGYPPAIQDFNGLLNQATAWDMWTAAAGVTPYDATFQTAIGGYPQGAVVYTATNTVPGRVWVSTADNNTTNPDTSGAGWLALMLASDISSVITAPITYTSGTAQNGQFYFIDLAVLQTFTLPNPSTISAGWRCQLQVAGSPSGFQTASAVVAAGGGSTAMIYAGTSHTPFYLAGGGEILSFYYNGTSFYVYVPGQGAAYSLYRSNSGGATNPGGGTLSQLQFATTGGNPTQFSYSSGTVTFPFSGLYLIEAKLSAVSASASAFEAFLYLASDSVLTQIFESAAVDATNSYRVNLSASLVIQFRQGQTFCATSLIPSGMNWQTGSNVQTVTLLRR